MFVIRDKLRKIYGLPELYMNQIHGKLIRKLYTIWIVSKIFTLNIIKQ